jgi:hypothetical protein
VDIAFSLSVNADDAMDKSESEDGVYVTLTI